MNLQMLAPMVMIGMRAGPRGSAGGGIRAAGQAGHRVFQGAGNGRGEPGVPDGHGSLGVTARGAQFPPQSARRPAYLMLRPDPPLPGPGADSQVLRPWAGRRAQLADLHRDLLS
jgi:hypothetical protein